MSASEENLLTWAKEVRGVEDCEADIATLEEIRNFLSGHEADIARNATHVILENYPDWWCTGRRAPPGLVITSDEDLETLFRHAGTMYGYGMPFTFAERRTPTFRLFQDFEVWGSRETSIALDQLVGPDCALTQLLGEGLREVFPGRDFLDASIYDATGLSQTKGVRKTSLRFVWPALIVDSDRAVRIRDLLVNRLVSAAAEGGGIKQLEEKLREQSPSNAWPSFLGDAPYSTRSNVRLPLNDRVSPLPLRAPERRPFSPVGVLRYTFSDDGKMKVEWLCRKAELDHSEWLKIGCVRQRGEAPLTEWAVPAWTSVAVQPVAPSGSRAGRVKVRTAGGSDGGGGPRLLVSRPVAPQPERAGQLITVERSISGTVDQFSERMEHHLGKPTVEADGSVHWKQPGGEARIVMYVEDKRIKVIGRANQVRSLIVIVSPFTDAHQGLGQVARPLGAARPLLSDGRPPSAAFAPAPAESEAENAAAPGHMRVAKQAFVPEGSGELRLMRGDRVQVTQDPEADTGPDRWVFGRSEANGESGWFPLSHTQVVPPPA